MTARRWLIATWGATTLLLGWIGVPIIAAALAAAAMVAGLALGWWLVSTTIDAVRRWTGRGEQPTPEAEPPTRRRAYMRAQTKLAVFDRDGGRCVACGSREELTVDHIIPFSKGGADAIENYQTLCARCNNSKGARLHMPEWQRAGD